MQTACLPVSALGSEKRVFHAYPPLLILPRHLVPSLTHHQATCRRRDSSLSNSVAVMSVTEFAEVSSLFAHGFFLQAVTFVLTFSVRVRNHAGSVCYKMFSAYFLCVVVHENKQKLLLLLWISQWNWDQKKPPKPGLSLGRLQFP